MSVRISFTDTALAAHGDYDEVLFDHSDLSGQTADSASFLDCEFVGCRSDDLRARRARIMDTSVTDLQATAVDLSESVWRDCTLTGGRIGALVLTGAHLTRVRIRAVKVDFLNVRGATVQDVSLADCVVGELTAATGQLSDVTLAGSRFGEIDVNGSTLRNVDISRAAVDRISGLEHLRGAVISPGQLLDLAPSIADHLGITVSESPD